MECLFEVHDLPYLVYYPSKIHTIMNANPLLKPALAMKYLTSIFNFSSSLLNSAILLSMEMEECSKLKEKILFIIKYTYTNGQLAQLFTFFHCSCFALWSSTTTIRQFIKLCANKIKILHHLCHHLNTQSFLILLVDSLSKLPLFTSTVSDPANS